MKKDYFGPAFLGLFIAIGLSVFGYFASQVVVNGKTGVNTAQVKGLAERVVDADLGQLDFTYSITEVIPAGQEDTYDQKAFYERAVATREEVKKIFLATGAVEDEARFSRLAVSSEAVRNRNGNLIETVYTFRGAASLVTKDLETVEKLPLAIEPLVAQEVKIERLNRVYRFVSLNEIKPEMVREATKNARIAASEFAKDAGVTVGSMQSATQGGFSIRDANNDGSETVERQKRVRVVTNITFYLKDN